MEFLLYLTPLGKEIINSVMLANYNIRENAPICRNREIIGFIKSKDFVICTNNIKNNISPVSYYVNETVYHEATHVAQYCKGSKLNIVTHLDKNKETNYSVEEINHSMVMIRQSLDDIADNIILFD